MSSGILQGAHDLVLNNPHLEDLSHKTTYKTNITANSTNNTTINNTTIIPETRPGLAKLLKASMPEAFHDSSARYPPPRCHPRTRQDYIKRITEWGSSSDARRLLWVQGPAGAGKSALAQTYTERMAEEGRLGGSVFFSRPNRRHNSNVLFTSIAYQLTTKFDAYADILDRRIERDPTLVDKSIREQFQELLVKPLQKLHADGVEIGDLVFIVDGLDECEGADAQCDIVEIVAMSVRGGNTHFRWIFVSRPETHITATFHASEVVSLSLHIELPVSREIDHEMLCFLTDELTKIGRKCGLPSTWQSEDDFQALVDLSAGLFVYAATIVRFVGEQDSLGPVDQLRSVLTLSKKAKRADDSDHPLAALDLFYTLIMQRIPSKILPTLQKILLLQCLCTSHSGAPCVAIHFANVLRLSESQFHTACGTLRSVLELEVVCKNSSQINFHHASFLDFIQDPKRSGKFSVYSGCQDTLCVELVGRLKNIKSCGTDVDFYDLTWPSGRDSFPENKWAYACSVWVLLCLASYHIRPLNPSLTVALSDFRFRTITTLPDDWTFPLSPDQLSKQVPCRFWNKIIRRSHNPLIRLQKPGYATSPYILGHGRNKVVCWQWEETTWKIESYPTLLESIRDLTSFIRAAIR